jgi:hypothetical protein
MAATSVAPRRKSEDWSNSRARGEALRAIQGDLTAYASGDNNWKRRSGEILAGWDKANESEKNQVVGTKKAEDLFEEDPYWGKKIVGTNVRIGEVSSKLNKGRYMKMNSDTDTISLRLVPALDRYRRFICVHDGAIGLASPTDHHGALAQTTREHLPRSHRECEGEEQLGTRRWLGGMLLSHR